MSHALTHFLIPAILVNLYRDFFVKDKQSFPLYYVLIAGLAGILPELDVAVFYVLSFFGYGFNEVHRVFTHTLLFVLIFVVIGVLIQVTGFKSSEIRKHRLKLACIFYVIAFGVSVHILLDVFVGGYLFLLLPVEWIGSIGAVLDAGLLIIWMVYLGVKHRFKDIF